MSLLPLIKMLTYGAALEEVPPVKEIILVVKIAQMVFKREALIQVDNNKEVRLTHNTHVS